MLELRKLLRQLKPYKGQVIISIICQILYAVFTIISIPLIIPFFQLLFKENVVVKEPQSIFDGAAQLEYFFSSFISKYSKMDALLYICGFIILTFFFKNLFRYLSLYFLNPVRNGIVRDLRSKMYNSLIHIPLHNLKKKNKGDTISRFSSDVIEVEYSILQVLEVLIKSPLIIIGSILFMLYISPSLTLFVFVLMLFTIFIIGTISKTLRSESEELQKSIAHINTAVEESSTGMINIRAYNRQQHWTSKFENHNDSFYRRVVRLFKRKDLASPLSEFLGVSIVAILLYYGASLVFQQSLSPETFFAFIFAFYQIIEPSKSFSKAFYNYQKGIAAHDRIHSFIDSKKVDSSTENKGTDFDFLKNEIAFENVTFKYPDGNVNVLENVSFSIRQGDTVAIIGPSGSGKSSIVSLLLKFYPTTDGVIQIDQKSLENLNSGQWREKIAFVSQDPFIFHDTLEENIRFGREYIVESDIKDALRQVYMGEYADQLDLQAGQDGQRFSGGEKQRISLARALAGNPDIIILDEPTSSLDPESESIVNSAINNATKDRTSIIIAHKMNTIQNSDLILFLKNGKIIEKGNHSDLMKMDGYYKKYLSLQSQKAE